MMRRRHDDPLPVRLYRWALVILPREFRRRFGAGMVAMLSDEWHDRRGLARGALLARAVFDLLRTAAVERVGGSGGQHQEEAGMRPSKMGGVSWLDVKLGLRMLVKHPALTLIGGLGLAVGLAISIGSYSLSASYIYPELPLDEGERIVALENRDIAQRRNASQAYDFFVWREGLESVEDLAAINTVERNLIIGGGPPELVHVAQMTASAFRLARVAPLLGRFLVEDDERAGTPPVVVIGYHVWRNAFDGDTAIVGRDLRLGGVAHTVVGVMPDGFAFPENHRFWTPFRASPTSHERREGAVISIAGRLTPGVTMESAQAELSVVGRRMAAAYPETHERLRPMVMPYTHSVDDIQGIALWQVIQGNLMVSLVLIVVALNVAVLVYARTAARHREIAVRSALGASCGRIATQLFVEALVLSVGASTVGLALARYGVRVIYGILEMETGRLAFWMDDGLRRDTVFLTIGAAVLVAVITGVLPALQATGRRLQSDLRQLDGDGMRLGRTWTALIVAQIAIAVAALPAAVNLGWGAILGALTQPTFPAEDFAFASLDPEAPDASAIGADARPNQATARFGDRLAELLRRLEADPAVAGATFFANLPGREGIVRVEGLPAPPEQPAGHRVVSWGVHPGFVEVYGARVLLGRSFEARDMGEGARAVIVSQTFVQRVLGGGEALGRRIRHVSEEERAGSGRTTPVRWYEIIGVVQDLRTNRAAPERVKPVVYYAVAPGQVQHASVSVRLRGSTPADFAARFREITAEVDPGLLLGTVYPEADYFREDQIVARLVGVPVGLVLLSALLLSAAGIYAMMSFTVTQRRREIGIRSALGAQPRQVVQSIFSRAAAQIALGLAVGVAMAAVIERLTGGQLLDGRGAVLLPGLALVMAVVGVLAALGPARRGLKVQPTEALRGDG